MPLNNLLLSKHRSTRFTLRRLLYLTHPMSCGQLMCLWWWTVCTTAEGFSWQQLLYQLNKQKTVVIKLTRAVPSTIIIPNKTTSSTIYSLFWFTIWHWKLYLLFYKCIDRDRMNKFSNNNDKNRIISQDLGVGFILKKLIRPWASITLSTHS